MPIEIGRGIGTRWETISIVDGMTVAELSEQLRSLPPYARIGIGFEKDSQNENELRIPVKVTRGNL